MRTLLFTITAMLLSVMVISCSDDEKVKEPEVATVILRVDSVLQPQGIDVPESKKLYTAREIMSSAKLVLDGQDFQTRYIYGLDEVYEPGYIYVIKAERTHNLWPEGAVCVEQYWEPYYYTLLEVISKSK